MSLPDAPHRPGPVPADLQAALTRAAPRLGAFAHQVRWFAEVSSTNDLAAMLADEGVPEGLVVIADTQTAGRGRRGRSWCSPPGAGLYVSIVLRPPSRVVPLVTLASGVALVEGISAATGLVTHLKWPNDLYASGRKVAGILVEASSSAGVGVRHAAYCVLGFGINVLPAAYPTDLAARATSLESELGRAVEKGPLLAECIASLAARYDDLRCDRTAAVLAAWRVHARPLLGRAVEWDSPDGVRRGTAEDVDASGALLVRTAQGTARVISGEVRWT